MRTKNVENVSLGQKRFFLAEGSLDSALRFDPIIIDLIKLSRNSWDIIPKFKSNHFFE